MGQVLLVRHGQASFGARDYDALSELGHRQAGLVADALRVRIGAVDVVASGNLSRQRDTAAPLAAALLPADGEVAYDDRWAEYDHEALLARQGGAWRRRASVAAETARTRDPKRAFQQALDEALEAWVADPEAEGEGESFGAFTRRCGAALDALVEDLDGGSAVVATSGGVIAAIAARELLVGGEGWVRLNRVMVNTGVTKLITGRRGVTLVSLNEHTHLEGDRALLSYR